MSTTHFWWIVDYAGPSMMFYDEVKCDTPRKAVDRGIKFLRKAKEWSTKFDKASVQGIEDAIEKLNAIPDSGGQVTVVTDTYGNYRTTVRIRQQVIPADEWAKISLARQAKAKDKKGV